MKVTVVVDNSVPISAPKPFQGEHGLSLLLELDVYKLLLDAGQSAAVVHNLSLLGLHPLQLDAIAISHGHYDHTGGLPHLLRHRCKPIPVYGHRLIFGKRYSVSGSEHKYVGIPFEKEDGTCLGADWHLTDKPFEIVPRLWFSGSMPRTTAFEQGDDKLVVCDEAGCYCQDSIPDDTALYYASDKGLVVISGCSHSGLVNTVQQGLAITGQTRLAGWIGGTHLGPVLPAQQATTLATLAQYSPDFVAANHCTGFAMMAALQDCFGPKFIHAAVGTVIEF